MANKYIIIINEVITDNQLKNFTDVLTSNYVNIKGGSNIYLVMTDDNVNPKSIYKIISEKTNMEFSFIVIEFNNWYGNLYTKAFDWLSEKFPNTKIIE